MKVGFFISLMICFALQVSSVSAKPVDEQDCKTDAEACFNAGLDYENGAHGVRQADEKACFYYEEGCQKGSGKACHNLGFLYEKGRCGEPDLTKAVEAYERGANYGTALSFSRLAQFYAPGGQLAEDENKEINYRKKACELGSYAECWNLASRKNSFISFSEGRLQTGCGKKRAEACFFLGKLESILKGSFVKAKTAFESGCNLNSAKACLNLAYLYSFPMDETQTPKLIWHNARDVTT